MGFERRRIWVATASAAALAMAAVPVAGGELAPSGDTREVKTSAPGFGSGRLVRYDKTREGDSDGCTVTLHEYHYDGGSRRSVKQAVCDDGAMKTLERHYDATGRLTKVSEHEITADGAVRLVENSDGGALSAAEASAEGADATLPEVSADEADREQTQEWLDAKFKEWNAEVEAQIAAPGQLRKVRRD
jgi:hypothetical protein